VGAASAATLAAMVATYLNQVLASSSFGMSRELDAYIATNAICNAVLATVGGAFAVGLAGLAADETEPADGPFAHLVIAGTAFAAVATLLAVLSPTIASLVVRDPGPLGPILLRLNLLTMWLNVSGTVASSLLIGRGRTLLGLASPALVSLGGVAGVLLGGREFGVVSLAVGTACGATARLAVCGLPFVLSGLKKGTLGHALAQWRSRLGLMASGMAVFTLGVVDKIALRVFADGTISRVSYSLMLMIGIVSVVTSALSAPMARRLRLTGRDDAPTLVADTTTASLLYLLPLGLVAAALGGPLASLAVGWGRVTAEDVAAIGRLMPLATGIALGPAFAAVTTYTLESPSGRRLVTFVTTISAVVAMVMFFVLQRFFDYGAIPLGYSFAYIIPPAVYVTLFLRSLDVGERTAIGLRWALAMVPAILAGLAGWAVARSIDAPSSLPLPPWADSSTLALGGAAAGITWCVALLIVRPLLKGVDSETDPEQRESSAWSLSNRTVVVFGSFTRHDWCQLRQRQQELVEWLSQDNKVVYFERHGARSLPAGDLVRAVIRRFSPDTRVRIANATRDEPLRFAFLRSFVLPWHGTRWIDALNARLVSTRLRMAAGDLEQCVAVVCYPSPYVLAVLERVSFESVIYDAVQRYGENPRVYGVNAEEADRRIAVIADVNSCDSVTIQEDRRAEGLATVRMVQGLGEQWLTDAGSEGKCSAAARLRATAGGRRVVGYAGALHAVVDWSLLRQLAEELPDVLLALVGPSFYEAPPELPENVLFLGWVPSRELPAVVREFDVGLIPYVLNRRTMAVLPTKMAEYLSQGTALVSTDLPDVRAFAKQYGVDWVRVTRNPEGFIAAVSALTQRPGVPSKVVSEIRAEMGWKVLIPRLVDEIEARIRSRRPSVLCVALNYRQGSMASDKTFVRALIQGVCSDGQLMPVVHSIANGGERVWLEPCRQEAEGIRVFQHARFLHAWIRASGSAREHHMHGPAREYLERTATLLAHRRALRWLVKRSRAVHVHYFDNLGGLMRWAPGLSKEATTVSVYSSTGSSRSLMRRLLWRWSFGSLGIVASSLVLAEELETAGGRVRAIVPWAPDALPPQAEGVPWLNRRVLAFTGPLQGTGPPELAIAAAAIARVCRQHPVLEGAIWPKPDFVEAYDPVARRNGFCVEVPASFREALGTVRVLVSPVPHEHGIVAPPLTWLEGLRAGSRIVTTPTRGIPDEWISGGAVVVATARSVDALVAAIETALGGRWSEPRIPEMVTAVQGYSEVWHG